MSSADRFSGDYYLTSINGNVYITANDGLGTTVITSDLLVVGRQTNIGSVETLIADNIITLSANVTGTPLLNAGIEVVRGDLPNVSLIWNETVDRWQVTNDGSYFANIMIRVEDDPDPHLGGNLWTNGFVIRSDTGENIRLNPGLGTTGVELSNIVGELPVVPEHAVVYAKQPAAGDSGIYISSGQRVDQELITKHRALVYSLVL